MSEQEEHVVPTLSEIIRANLADVNMKSETVVDDCIQAICDGLNEWIPEHVQVNGLFEGTAPGGATETIVDTWKGSEAITSSITKWASNAGAKGFSTWVAAVSNQIKLGVKFGGAGVAGVTIDTPVVVTGGTLALSQSIFKKKAETDPENACEAIWDYIEGQIKTMLLVIAGSTAPATHLTFSGEVTQTVNIIE